MTYILFLMKLTIAVLLCWATAGFADDGGRLLRLDHYVQVHSTVPAIAGQLTEIYVREVVEAGTVAARRTGCRSRGAVHPRRGHAGGSCLRRSLSGLQLDGLPGARRLRRVFHGHDRLWPFHASRRDERSLQSHERAAGAVRSFADFRALRRQLSAPDDDARFGLARYRRGGGSGARAASRGQAESAGVVAGRTALGGLRGAASGQGRQAGVAGARVQSCGESGAAGAGARQWRGLQHAVAAGIHHQLGSPGGLSRSIRDRAPSIRSGPR